jgi:hypothetical protein
MNPNRPVGPVVEPLPTGAKPDLRPLPGRWLRLDAVSVAHHGVSLYNSFAKSGHGCQTPAPSPMRQRS